MHRWDGQRAAGDVGRAPQATGTCPATPAGRAVQPVSRSGRPRRIGCLAADPSPEALLARDDFADALAAYEWLSTIREPEGGARPMEPVRLSGPVGSVDEPSRGACLKSEGRLEDGAPPLEALAIAGMYGERAGAAGTGEQLPVAPSFYLQSLLDTGCVADTARVYAIAISLDGNGDHGIQAVARWRAACEGLGLLWSGAVVVTDGDLFSRLMRAPRLGAWRRPVAEAVDQLVAAARLNGTLASVAGLLCEGSHSVTDSEPHSPRQAAKPESGAAGSAPDSGAADDLLIASPAPLWRSVLRAVVK